MSKDPDTTNRDRQARFRENRRHETMAAAAERTRQMVHETTTARERPGGLPDAPEVPPHLIELLSKLDRLFSGAVVEPIFDTSGLCFLAFPRELVEELWDLEDSEDYERGAEDDDEDEDDDDDD